MISSAREKVGFHGGVSMDEKRSSATRELHMQVCGVVFRNRKERHALQCNIPKYKGDDYK